MMELIKAPSILLYLVLAFVASVPVVSSYENHFCPKRCLCSKFTVKSLAAFTEKVKAKCGDDIRLNSVEELALNSFNLTDVVNLDLSENNITRLSSNVFPVAEFQKLDLSHNRIVVIEEGAFSNLVSLKRLDLSNNKLRSIEASSFEGLINLEKLKLGENLIRTVKEGVFDGLLSLKTLDLSGNPLLCDCELWWLATWSNNMSIKLSPMPKCSEPAELRQQPLRKLKAYSQQCSWPETTSPPLLELSPDHDQVVFEGDSLRLDCKAPTIRGPPGQESSVSWFWAGLPPTKYFDSSSIHIETRHPPDSTVIESTIIIKELHSNHTGEWNCDLVSNEGNQSSSVSVIVISNETNYCQPTASKDNKGEYYWPKTVAGHMVELPCAANVGYPNVARNNCTLAAQWVGANTSNCPFLSETTRILHQYAKMNLSAGRSSVNESAIRLHNYTFENKHSLTDPDDIVFISRTINNYLEFLQFEKTLGTLLLELINLIMDLDAHLLSEAQMHDRSCTKLLAAIETIAQYQFTAFHSVNMLVEKIAIPRESFLGMTCTWWNSRERAERFFRCSTNNTTSFRISHDEILEASIQIPPTLFQQLELSGKPPTTHQIMISIYDNAKLFPTLFNVNRSVASPVVGAKLVGAEVRDLDEPVYIMLGGLKQGVAPAWWDEGLGDWVIPPCRPSHLLSDLLVTKCYHLGYFALITDLRSQPPPVVEQAPSRKSSPAVFVGTFIGAPCLLVSAFTYVICHSAIQMSQKMKHALANSWIAVSTLALVFNIGVYQTSDIRICQAIGLLLHYLTLCSLFWLAVSINGMHRCVGKLVRVVSDSSDVDEGGPQVVGQPLVGLYLIGWGVSALLVGLSGAVNPMGYASPTYCTLGPGPGFIPVLVPVSALFVFIFTRALMVRSAAVEKDSNAQLSEGTQATDLELLETGVTTGDGESVHSVATPSSQVEDLEHPPYVQLKAFLIVTCLFVLSWTVAALSVIKPFSFPHEETFFSVAYAVFITVLGFFVVFFYCFSRSDVRSVWFTMKHIKRSRNVTDLPTRPIINPSNTPPTLERKSISPRPDSQGDVLSHVKPNFVDIHRRQYQNNVVTEPNTFYNPHQSIVARKFFKKQRRKRNNLNNRRRGAGDGIQISPDNSELFHLGSKVNNTNIHVEPPTPRSTDRNVLGDRRPLERFVVGAESCEPTLNNDGSVKYASVASECCSCLVSEAHSVTDCTRDITSEHSSRSSHLYATVAPDLPSLNSPRMTIDLKNEAIHLKFCQHHKSSDEDKRETSV